MNFLVSLLLLVARMAIAALFLSAGVNKLINYNDTVQYMTAHGFTMVPFFLFGAAAIEVIGGLALIFGIKTRVTAFILILFLIPTTAIFHSFWTLSGGEAVLARLFFFHNLALIGGLIYVLCYGAGKFACDRSCECKEKDTNKVCE